MTKDVGIRGYVLKPKVFRLQKVLGNNELLRYITVICNYVTDFYGIQIPAIIFKIQEFTTKYTISQY